MLDFSLSRVRTVDSVLPVAWGNPQHDGCGALRREHVMIVAVSNAGG
jgi:hypothetical protein